MGLDLRGQRISKGVHKTFLGDQFFPRFPRAVAFFNLLKHLDEGKTRSEARTATALASTAGVDIGKLQVGNSEYLWYCH